MLWRFIVAFYWGFRDGWEQPYELVSSANIEHLTNDRYDLMRVQEWLDHGINVGQSLRAGSKSQADRERYVPFGLRRRLALVPVALAFAGFAGSDMATGAPDGRTMLYTLGAVWALFMALTGWPAVAPYEPREGA